MAGHSFKAQPPRVTLPQTSSSSRTRQKSQEIKRPNDPALIKVKFDILSQFTQNLAILLEAGIPVVQALLSLSKESEDAKFSIVVQGVVQAIETGSTFSDAIAFYPGVFSSTYISTVKAGEKSGKMEIALKNLSVQMDKERKIRAKIKSAMTYPLVVLGLAICILFFLMIVIVPKFKDIFDDILDGKPLPFITRAVMAVSNGLVNNLLLVTVLTIALIAGIRFAMKTDKGRKRIDWLKYNALLFGKLYRKASLARFARTLSSLQASGVPVLESLIIARDTSGNSIVEKAIQTIHDGVKEGETIAGTMEATKIFPSSMLTMVSVGEDSSKLPEMLEKVANRYEEEVDNAVNAITSIIEPIMIVILALIVGTIVLAIFLPMVELLKGFS